MADDDWAKAIEEQEGHKIAAKVENLNISQPGGGAIPKRPPVTGRGDAPSPTVGAAAAAATAVDNSGWEEAQAASSSAEGEEKALSPEEISLLQKALHKKLVTTKADLEVLQKDPNSPLYSVKSFEKLSLKRELLDGIYDMGFNAPSKIQETALPALLADPPQNMIAQSQSGTGKTAAFVLTMLSRVDTSLPYTQCLCLAPTYELALQIGDNTTKMAKHMKDVKIGFAVRGGERVERGCPVSYHIVIGTPGTMLDWCTKLRVIDPKKVTVFVLDEADVMIGTQGHQDQSIRVVKGLKKDCQMLLFSATYDAPVMKFAQAIVPNPVLIRLRREEESLENIKQYYIDCHDAQSRFQALSNIYGTISIGQSMIFCRTKKTAAWLAEKMTGDGHTVALLSGELNVEQRAAVINRFRVGKEKVLITTNVSARGLDIEQVTLVVNFDLPVDMQGRADCETYLHRIGRTGRFGKTGIAINFVDGHRSIQILQEIEKHFGRKIMKLDADDADAIEQLES